MASYNQAIQKIHSMQAKMAQLEAQRQELMAQVGEIDRAQMRAQDRYMEGYISSSKEMKKIANTCNKNRDKCNKKITQIETAYRGIAQQMYQLRQKYGV